MTSNPNESDLVLAISPDNRMIHVGPACELLDHVDQGAGIAAPPLVLEFYDVGGRRRSIRSLQSQWCGASNGPAVVGSESARAPELEAAELEAAELEAAELEAAGLEAADAGAAAARSDPGLGRPTQRVLLRRIREALALGQTVLSEHPELGNQGSNIPPATEVPRPEGSYPEVLEQLAFAFSPLAPSTRGNWLHNLYHAATGTS